MERFFATHLNTPADKPKMKSLTSKDELLDGEGSSILNVKKQTSKKLSKVNFNCYFCKRIIKNIRDLQHHIKQHTLEGYHHCGKCQRSFIHNRYYKKHLSRGCKKETFNESSIHELKLRYAKRGRYLR